MRHQGGSDTEDLPTDAELAEREVRRVIPGAEFLRVETRDAFLSALTTFRPDVILSVRSWTVELTVAVGHH